MPPSDDHSSTVKQYRGIAPAGGAPIIISPADNTFRRNLYGVQNIGVNEGEFWWDDAKDSGQAFRLAPGDVMTFKDPCPSQRSGISSQLGTVFAIVEGFKPRDSSRG